jgi:hypothetical protein
MGSEAFHALTQAVEEDAIGADRAKILALLAIADRLDAVREELAKANDMKAGS